MKTTARTLQFGASLLALTAAYYLAGKFGLSLAFVNASASAVWPPTGMALAALLLFGPRLWPGIFLGAFLVNLTTQGSVATSLGIAAGNTLEAIVAAWLVGRMAGGRRFVEQGRTVFKFILLASVLSTMVSATVGVVTLCLGSYAHWGNVSAVWLTWWLGDMVSNLLIAPLLVIWGSRGLPRLAPRRLLEGVALLATVAVTGKIIFLEPFSGDLPLEYVALFPLLWAAFRFGAGGAVTGAFLTSGLALWGTLQGSGPFAKPDPNASLLLLQAFIGTISITVLILAAIIAERKKTEAALAEAQAQLKAHADNLEIIVAERTEELRETIAEIESFSYSISHDMRGPLRAMHGYAAILAEELKGKIGDEEWNYLGRIVNAAARLNQLVQGILSYSQISRSKLSLAPVDLQALLLEMKQHHPHLQSSRVELCLEEPLPVVLGHETALMQIFSNLLGNATKFVPAGTTPRITISAESAGPGFVRIWVADNGIGIDPKNFERIFQMFEQVNSPKDYEGTGIGLAIVKRAVERLGGKIGVVSELGKGARFWFDLRGVSD